MLASTIEYSLGRQTYMTSLAPELVVKYRTALSADQLRQISKIITDRVNRWGVFPDRDSWLEAAEQINQLAEGS